MADEVWTAIAAERAALADALEGLSEDQWDTPSLCEGWTVRDVLAHLTGSAKVTGLTFFPKLIGSGFSLTRMQNKDIARERGASPKETLQNFRSVITSTKSPPGPKATWLGEALIHGEDIRRPLAIERTGSTDAAVVVADFYKGSNLVVGAKKRIAGLTLKATDADWSTGEGPTVSGPITSLVMAMTGRRSAIDDLEGDGVATLRSRG